MTRSDCSTERLRSDALRIIRCGVAAADPAERVRRALRLDNDRLSIGSDLELPLPEGARILLVGVGKAAAPMSIAAAEVLGDRIAAACVTVPRQSGPAPVPPPSLPIWEADHPVPDMGGLAAAAEALALARSARTHDVLLCLLSGGASAMWAAPAPGLTLDDLRASTSALLRCGAPIQSVNAVRKHLSAIAGGQLARAAAPARVVTLAVSDVVGAGPDAIGSGPTLPDPTTFRDALEVVDRYGVALPGPALARLHAGAAGEIAETPGEEDLDNVAGFRVVLSVEHALEAASAEAERLGYQAEVRTASLEGEASDVGARVAAEARAMSEQGRSRALLWGGETTVTVRGGGRGGRNQETALSAAIALEGSHGVVVASAGTDGRDGPTDAAGGIVDGDTVRRGKNAGCDALHHLRENDSYTFLRATNDLIVTGPTGTNVNDLLLALISSPPGDASG